MFRTFVVALDLGDDGDRALPVVEALASRGPMAVELVTVSSPGMPAEADSWELERRAARFSNCRATWNVIVDSDIARGLLQHVAGRPESVLVMTTSARRPLTAALFGGVVHDVLRNTDGPVLLVGPQVDDEGRARHHPDRLRRRQRCCDVGRARHRVLAASLVRHAATSR